MIRQTNINTCRVPDLNKFKCISWNKIVQRCKCRILFNCMLYFLHDFRDSSLIIVICCPRNLQVLIFVCQTVSEHCCFGRCHHCFTMNLFESVYLRLLLFSHYHTIGLVTICVCVYVCVVCVCVCVCLFVFQVKINIYLSEVFNS